MFSRYKIDFRYRYRIEWKMTRTYLRDRNCHDVECTLQDHRHSDVRHEGNGSVCNIVPGVEHSWSAFPSARDDSMCNVSECPEEPLMRAGRNRENIKQFDQNFGDKIDSSMVLIRSRSWILIEKRWHKTAQSPLLNVFFSMSLIQDPIGNGVR